MIFYIYIYIYIIGDICTCKVSINKIRNVGTSVIPLFRVILTEISIYCITFMIQGHFQSQKVHFKARSSNRKTRSMTAIPDFHEILTGIYIYGIMFVIQGDLQG